MNPTFFFPAKFLEFCSSLESSLLTAIIVIVVVIVIACDWGSNFPRLSSKLVDVLLLGDLAFWYRCYKTFLRRQ
jgi:hypothetical protein